LREVLLEFIPFEAHIGSVRGAADMSPAGPVAGPIQGRTFFCPLCGALYSVTHSRLPKGDSDSHGDGSVVKCVVCLQTMDTWETTEVRNYKLVHRPEDA
jgi:predicted Zn finger-like uncharacterized protein